MTKLLVLGDSGQLGRALVASATRSSEVEVVTLGPDRIEMRDPEALLAALDAVAFDVLVNCAAYTAVDAAEREATDAFAVNAFAVEALGRHCADLGRRFVHVSTDYVFDGEARQPYRPTAAPGPLNVYGASKLVGEVMALRAHPEGTVIVRTSSLFGHGGGRAGRTNFVDTMLRLAATGEKIRVVDDVRMTPTSAADLAAGILRMIEAGPAPGRYHLCNAGEATWLEFARSIFEAASERPFLEGVPAADYPMAARRPRYSVLDSSGTLELIGPMPHWRDGLERYLAEK